MHFLVIFIESAEAEISQLILCFVNEDVLRLQIAVYDIVIIQLLHPLE